MARVAVVSWSSYFQNELKYVLLSPWSHLFFLNTQCKWCYVGSKYGAIFAAILCAKQLDCLEWPCKCRRMKPSANARKHNIPSVCLTLVLSSSTSLIWLHHIPFTCTLFLNTNRHLEVATLSQPPILASWNVRESERWMFIFRSSVLGVNYFIFKHIFFSGIPKCPYTVSLSEAFCNHEDTSRQHLVFSSRDTRPHPADTLSPMWPVDILFLFFLIIERGASWR